MFNCLYRFECVCVQIPCWGAAPVRCLEGPLAASACQQLPPATAEHPGEGDKQMPWCLFGCLFMISMCNSKNLRPWLSLCSFLFFFFPGYKVYGAKTLPQIFSLAGCKGLRNNVETVSHSVNTQKSAPAGDDVQGTWLIQMTAGISGISFAPWDTWSFCFILALWKPTNWQFICSLH